MLMSQGHSYEGLTPYMPLFLIDHTTRVIVIETFSISTRMQYQFEEQVRIKVENDCLLDLKTISRIFY